MVRQPIFMVTQLCIIDIECYDVIDNLFNLAKNETESSTGNLTIGRGFVEYDLYTEDILFTAFCLASMGSGIILNLLTVFVLVLGKKNSSETRVQLVNLAIADCLISVVEPLIYYYMRFYISVNLPQCKFAGFAQYCTLTLSMLCSAAISIDRFMAVYFPLKVQRYKTRHKICTAVALWLISVAVDFGTVYNCNLWEIQDSEMCFCTPVMYEPLGIPNQHFIRFSKNAIPAFVIILLYTLIGIRIVQWKTKVGTVGMLSTEKQQQELLMKKKIRSTISILFIDSMVTLVTWLPFTIHLTVSTHYVLHTPINFAEEQVQTIINLYRIKELTVCLLLTNCFTTPIIYFCFNKPFREDLWALIKRCRCTKKRFRSLKTKCRSLTKTCGSTIRKRFSTNKKAPEVTAADSPSPPDSPIHSLRSTDSEDSVSQSGSSEDSISQVSSAADNLQQATSPGYSQSLTSLPFHSQSQRSPHIPSPSLSSSPVHFTAYNRSTH